jgi:[ribosomal protein S18]-alanine N-acetyltransferase
MSYTFVPLRVRDALEAGRWRYQGRYAIYDFDRPALVLTALLQRLLFQQVFYSVLDERGTLLGLFTFTRTGDTLEVGLGMRPDLTGKGRGLEFLEAGLAFARRRYAPRHFALDVATFNERAQRVYMRAGFVPLRTFRRRTKAGWLEHIEMTRKA